MRCRSLGRHLKKGICVKAISVWQPWAEYIADGLKTIEVRTHNRFQSLRGQRIAIQAAGRFDKNAGSSTKHLIIAGKVAAGMRSALNAMGHSQMILCTAFVKDFRLLSKADSQAALCDCSVPPSFGLVLCDVMRLGKPIPCKGRQTVFEVEIP